MEADAGSSIQFHPVFFVIFIIIDIEFIITIFIWFFFLLLFYFQSIGAIFHFSTKVGGGKIVK